MQFHISVSFPHVNKFLAIKVPGNVSRKMTNNNTDVTVVWLGNKIMQAWLACGLDLSPNENLWQIIQCKTQQGRSQTAEQLQSYIKQE